MWKSIRTILLGVGLIAGLSVAGGSIATAQSGAYAAMGDSVAAGAGLQVSASASEVDVACERSRLAYPYLAASQLGKTLNHQACAGATFDDGIFGKQERAGWIMQPQLNKVMAPGTPEMITITAGANDARWTQFLYQCYVGNCDSRATTAAMKVLLADMRLELNWTLHKIKQQSGEAPPTVLVTGYYNPVSERTCVDLEQITTGEWRWIDNRAADLNAAIEQSLRRYDFAHFVPVDFSGHGLCSSNSWVQGVSAAAPFHPTAAGQRAIADAVVATYRGIETTPEAASEKKVTTTDSPTRWNLGTLREWIREGDAQVRAGLGR